MQLDGSAMNPTPTIFYTVTSQGYTYTNMSSYFKVPQRQEHFHQSRPGNVDIMDKT